MSTIFTQVAADVARDQVFPALIKKIELKGSEELEAAYADVGPLDGCKLTIDAVSQNSSGGVPIQLGYKVALEGTVLATGTNMRTAISNLIGAAHDSRLTDVNGHVYEFLSSEFALTHGEVIEGDFEGARKIPIKGGGHLTKARYTAVLSTS